MCWSFATNSIVEPGSGKTTTPCRTIARRASKALSREMAHRLVAGSSDPYQWGLNKSAGYEEAMLETADVVTKGNGSRLFDQSLSRAAPLRC